MIYTVYEIIFSIIEGITLFILYNLLNSITGFIRNNKVKFIAFIFIYSFIACGLANFILNAFRPIFLIIMTAILLSYFTKTNVLTSLTTTAISSVIIFTIELFSSFLPMLIFRLDLNSLVNSKNLRIPLGLFFKVTQLVIAIILSKSNIKFKKLNLFKGFSSLSSLLALQALIISIIIFSANPLPDKKIYMIQYNIFLSVLYVFFLSLVIVDTKERERLQAIQYKFQAQEEYIGNMETIINIIRREKHDFSNHLNTLLAISALNKPDTKEKIEGYIRKLSNSTKTSYHFFNTGNDYVDGLLAVKSNYAFEHNIHLDVDFEASLQDIEINDCDLTSIISNVIDNAFDSIISTDHSEGKVVSVATYKENSNYYLSISNNGPRIPEKNVDILFDNGFTTKSSSKNERGFGLYIVKQLVIRNNGSVSVKSDDEETEFLFKFRERG